MTNSYLTNPDTSQVLNSEDFDLGKYVSVEVPDERLLLSSEGRKELTRFNPLLFALIYMPHVLKSEATNDQLSINDLNLLLSHHAMEWVPKKNQPKRHRHAFLSPRSSGKSSTLKCLLIWAMAHKHTRYIMILSGSDTQSIQHLTNIRKELDGNKVLQADYPTLCIANQWIKRRVSEADRANKYVSKSGVAIEARSIGSSVLGSKEGDTRPDLLILDDSSKGEGVGSANQAKAQLEVILGTVLPLNLNAPVWLIGTNHFIGSIEDQLLRTLKGETFDWVSEEGIQVHWMQPLIARPDGSLRSMWPEQWPSDWLIQESNKRTYAKDFRNEPQPLHAGMGWETEDFVYETLPSYSKVVISVDPSGSDKGDAVGLSIVGFSQAAKRAVVLDVLALQIRAIDLKREIMKHVNLHNPSILVWESTYGGRNLAEATLGIDFPLPIHYVSPKESKAVRAELLLNRYKKGQVLHAKPFPSYEMECRAFPNWANSPNQLDSVQQAIEYLATAGRTGKPLRIGVRQ